MRYGLPKQAITAAVLPLAFAVASCAPQVEETASPAPAAAPAPAAPPAAATPAPQPAAAGSRTVLDAVFTLAQATRGQQQFQTSCASCHSIAEFSGAGFQRVWNNRTLGDVHQLISTMMPLDAPGSLSAQQYTDIIAHFLRANGYPAGQTELSPVPASLRQVRIVPST